MPPQPTTGPALRPGPVPDDVLRAVLASDQAMYPAPLRLEHLRAWVHACPALAVCFYRADDAAATAPPAGASITLPLRAGPWRALLAGRLRETDVGAADLATTDATAGDAGGVGLHVFHVERFDAGVRGLAAHALRHGLDVAAAMGWKVLGCSALTATPEGARAFAKLGFEPTGYEEVWLRDAGAGGPARLVPILPGEADQRVGGKGAVGANGSEQVVGEARMAVRYGDDSTAAVNS